MAVLTHASPCMPIMPRYSGWDAGMPPMPSSVIAIGMCARSAKCWTMPVAPEMHDAVAGQDDRPLGVVDQLDSAEASAA